MYTYCLVLLGVTALSPVVAQGVMRNHDSIQKIEMKLDAFGVESDNFPNIEVTIDLLQDTSLCRRSYYDPRYSSATYRLSAIDMQQIKQLVNYYNLFELDTAYTLNTSDQPTSTVVIYTSTRQLKFTDYGLRGSYPLPLLYELAYKFGD